MKDSKISWTDHTFNPWIGCTKVSPGCENCYALAQDRLRRWTPQGWGKGKPRKRASYAYWRDPIVWNKWAAAGKFMECTFCGRQFSKERRCKCEQPLAVVKARPRVFCASLADWLDDEVPVEWLTNLLELVHATPNLDWLLLTKRPGNWQGRTDEAFQFACEHGETERHNDFCDWLGGWVHAHVAPENIWIGTSVENQKYADKRIPELLGIPAKVRFLSCEPLLGELNLVSQSEQRGEHYKTIAGTNWLEGIQWVICGGESGGCFRMMETKWAEWLAEQCSLAGVAFFMKQDCSFRPGQQGRLAEELFNRKEFPKV